MQRDSFWIGWGTKDFILHKVHSGRALPLNCYFLSLTEHKIFFSSQNHMCNCQLLSCSTVPAVHKLCHCSTIQLFKPICTLLHTCTLFMLAHSFAHLDIYTHFCKFNPILYTCTFLHICTLACFCTFSHLHIFAHLQTF